MTTQTAALPEPLLEALEGTGATHIVHVGGGDGALLADLVGRLPRATGVLFDEPGAAAAAGPVLEAAGVDDRVDVVSGGPDEPVPPGGDVYLVVPASSIDAGARAVLVRCRAGMAAAARLLIFEARPSPDDGAGVRDLVELVENAGFDIASLDQRHPSCRIVVARPTS